MGVMGFQRVKSHHSLPATLSQTTILLVPGILQNDINRWAKISLSLEKEELVLIIAGLKIHLPPQITQNPMELAQVFTPALHIGLVVAFFLN